MSITCRWELIRAAQPGITVGGAHCTETGLQSEEGPVDLAEEYKLLFAGPHLTLLNRPRGCVGVLARANEGVPGGNATSVATVLRGDVLFLSLLRLAYYSDWLLDLGNVLRMYIRHCAPLS